MGTDFSEHQVDRLRELMTDLQSAEELLALSPDNEDVEKRRNAVLHSLQMQFGHQLQALVDDGTDFPPVVLEAKSKLLDYLRSTGALDPEYLDDADEKLTDMFSGTDLIQGHDDGEGPTPPSWTNN